MTPTRLPKVNILLAESDSEHSVFLRGELERAGYSVQVVEDEGALKERLAQEEIHVVILDLELSRAARRRLVGELCAEAKGPSALPKVVLLVPTALMSREEAYHRGAAVVLSKPIDPEQLVARLEHILIPTYMRWGNDSPSTVDFRYDLHSTVETLPMGSGGFRIPSSDGQSLFEGEPVSFDLRVLDPSYGRVRGTGVVRFVSVNPQSRAQEAWGIEIESLEKECLQRVLHGIEQEHPRSYIPSALF